MKQYVTLLIFAVHRQNIFSKLCRLSRGSKPISHQFLPTEFKCTSVCLFFTPFINCYKVIDSSSPGTFYLWQRHPHPKRSTVLAWSSWPYTQQRCISLAGRTYPCLGPAQARPQLQAHISSVFDYCGQRRGAKEISRALQYLYVFCNAFRSLSSS